MKKQLFSILILGSLSLSVFSQNNSNAELAALVRKAFDHYPRLVEASLATQAAGLRTDIQRAGFLPQVTSQASFNYLDPITEVQFGQSKLQFQPHDNYNVGLSGSGLLFDFGRTKAQIDKAIAEAAVAQNSQESVKNVLAYQVAQLFYSLVFSKKQLAVQAEQLKSLQANEDLINAKLKNGDALDLDLLNAEVALANAQNRVTDLTATMEKQQALLAMLTGDATAQISSQVFDFQEVKSENGSTQNPDLTVANSKILVAEKEIAVNKKFLRPSINYNAGLGFRNGYVPDIHEFRFNWAVGASISYPIYVGGRDKKQLKLSELNLLAAKSSATGVSETIASDLAQANADLRAADAKLKTAATVVTQAKSALELAKVRFKNGVATNVDVLTAQTNLEQAQLTAVAAEFQKCLAEMQIGKLQGFRFW